MASNQGQQLSLFSRSTALSRTPIAPEFWECPIHLSSDLMPYFLPQIVTPAPSPEEETPKEPKTTQDSEEKGRGEEKLPELLSDLFKKQRSEFQADLAAALEPIKAQLALLAKEKVEELSEKDLDAERETTQSQGNLVHAPNEMEDGEHQHRKVTVAFRGTADEAQEASMVTSLIGFLNQICPEGHVSERDFERVPTSAVPTWRERPRGEYGHTEISVHHDLSIKRWRKRRMLPGCCEFSLPVSPAAKAFDNTRMLQLHQERDIEHRKDLPFRLLVHLNGRTFWASPDHDADICDALRAGRKTKT